LEDKKRGTGQQSAEGPVHLKKSKKVVGPRLKKLAFYDFEDKLNKAYQKAQ